MLSGRVRIRRSGCIVAVTALLVSFAGCRSLVDRPDTALEISAEDFDHLNADGSRLDIVQVPPSVFTPEEVQSTSETESDAQGELVTTQKAIVEKNADGTERTIPVGGPVEDIQIKVGGKWTIDSLVGQINGRPVYASRFMESIEDHILRIVAENPRPAAQKLIAQLVAERFQQYINNELVIAEAEGTLTPQMQEGVFAWLQSIQEQTVAGYGGNRTSASQSLQDLFGMNMEEYLQEKRDEALAQDLIRRRVKPRTIVSWRDVERQYSMLEATFNPVPQMTVARVRLPASDTAQIQEVEAWFARGDSFAQVAEALKLPEGGEFQKYQLTSAGIDGTDLAVEIRKALVAVEHGEVTAAIRTTSAVSWYCVTKVESQQSRSIFDPVLQRQIRHGLEDQRGRYEQHRYLGSLRDKWVTSDIDSMTRRLTAIAWDRYLPS